jgi:hypothetical protein
MLQEKKYQFLKGLASTNQKCSDDKKYKLSLARPPLSINIIFQVRGSL